MHLRRASTPAECLKRSIPPLSWTILLFVQSKLDFLGTRLSLSLRLCFKHPRINFQSYLGTVANAKTADYAVKLMHGCLV